MPVAPDLSGVALDGRYELHDVLGEGAFGRVYRGIDRRLARPVAVKVIKPWWSDDPEWVDAFEREAQLLARVSNPGIVQIYDVGQAPEGLYYVSELVEGESLQRKLRRGPIEPGQAASLAEQLARALAEAHAQRIIHRDIKPANILISEQGRLKVGDFGVARLAEGSTDGAIATVVGTPRYMAPEQGRGEDTTPATDVYSAGIVLYEMLAGQPPFTGTSVAELAISHLQDEPPPLPATTPVRLREIVATALAKEPRDRYQDAGEMARAIRDARRRGMHNGSHPPTPNRLEQTVLNDAGQAPRNGGGQALGARTLKAPPPAPIQRHNPAARRRTVAAFVLVGAVIAAMLIVAFAMRSGPTVTVPGVGGATRGAVLGRMRRAGLKVRFRHRFSASVPAGRVISESPGAGASVARGSHVEVVLSRGPRPVKLSDYVGLSQHDATMLLSRAGLHSQIVTGPDPGQVPGTVYRQEPAAESLARAHSTVTLYEAEVPRWQPLLSFSGSGPVSSNPFAIRGSKWRIVYSMQYSGVACSLPFLGGAFCSGPSVRVIDTGSGQTVASFGMNTGTNQTYELRAGPGTYEVLISPGNSAHYTAAVDDYF